jgi:steroid delta-isomerase-like uncharacterized protein
MEDPKDVVRPLYTDCFTVNTRADASAVMNRILADDFQSLNAAGAKSKAQLIGQVQFFWKLIPDLAWEVQEMLRDGDKVVVRSIATGTPKGDFMGIPCDGTRSFRVMTIDIHTVEGGRVKRVHHVEEWTTAMAQLRGG